MPKSHWHFELLDGHPDLLAALLPELGVDPAELRDRNDGSAIAFSRDEDERLHLAVKRLIDGMRQSDFSLLFPEAESLAVVTLHHHRQIWWQTPDAALIARLAAQSTQSSSSTTG